MVNSRREQSSYTQERRCIYPRPPGRQVIKNFLMKALTQSFTAYSLRMAQLDILYIPALSSAQEL